MSSPSSPRPNPHSTKQLLDELDALMQRMLELPVNETETAPASHASPPASVASPTELPEPPKSASYIDPPQPAPTLDTPKSWPAPPIRVPAFVSFPEAPRPPNAPRFDQLGKPIAAESAHAPDLPSPRAATTTGRPFRGAYGAPISTLPGGKPLPPAPVRREWVLRPLMFTNRVFDRGTVLLGPAGRWLRTDLGRTVLGWSGLAMTAGAVAWGLFKLLG